MDHQPATIAASTYVSRLAFEQQSRAWIRRSCDVLVNVNVVSHGAEAPIRSRLHVHMISESGMVASACRDDIPDCFCISIGAEQYHIACASVHRQDGRLHIRFIKQQPEAFVMTVASLTDRHALLEAIDPDVYGLAETVDPSAGRAARA
ncbi:hypothetical protein DFR52_102796 [Hoeflea marina]|uniref:PilZ domain-containing protein n=1 Tax=Hoeflea marina TaxID=274592 RepID=A0A317PQA4_9HYPH|nr:hypothetical protein [Hoeflea marina]PWW02128.1 hypothetical protein DFR52_102796 [Hoeflea marina]